MAYLNYVFPYNISSQTIANRFNAPGGIQIGSGSERIKVIDDCISGGADNGITLGSSLDLAGILEEGSLLPDKIENGSIRGNVIFHNIEPQEEIILIFENIDNSKTYVSEEPTDSSGIFYLHQVPNGEYRVFIDNTDSNNRYRIINRERTTDRIRNIYRRIWEFLLSNYS